MQKMIPDAGGTQTSERDDPYAPLTTQVLSVGDGHELYVETVGNADGVPAVYLHGGWRNAKLMAPVHAEQCRESVNSEAEPAGRITPVG